MSLKVIAFGVRTPERKVFEDNNKFNYDLQLESGSLNESTMEVCKGFDAVITRASDTITEKVVQTLKEEYGIKYILTRTAGYNHLDLEAFKKYNVLSAKVPGYSPSAISEVAFSTAYSLNRRTLVNAAQVAKGNYVIEDHLFAREMRNTKVGIIGVGKIGSTTAKLFANAGAKVYGFDMYPNDQYKSFVEYVDQDTLLKECDIVVLHCNYVPGQNDNLINKETIAKMKDSAILINAARGELMSDEDIYEALTTNKLYAVASDVLRGEKAFFNKKEGTLTDAQQKLINLFPRFVLTMHIGSYTEEAVQDMVTISYDNLNELVETGKCKNQI